MNVRHYITDGIAVFNRLQILNFSTSRKIEMFVLEDNTVEFDIIDDLDGDDEL